MSENKNDEPVVTAARLTDEVRAQLPEHDTDNVRLGARGLDAVGIRGPAAEVVVANKSTVMHLDELRDALDAMRAVGVPWDAPIVFAHPALTFADLTRISYEPASGCIRLESVEVEP